jgi:hypothetical protein
MAKEDWLDKLHYFHARMFDRTSSDAERDKCRVEVDKLLKRHGKTGFDLPELLDEVRRRRAPPARPAPPPPPAGSVPITGFDLFKVIRAVLNQYLTLEEHEYTACALWIMHTYVFSRFVHTPRLGLRSPLRNCGKTLTLDVIGELVPDPKKFDHATAAAFFREADAGGTILLDEVDNLGLLADPTFMSVLNGGHRRGRTVARARVYL